ncbi:CRAL-TRIO domain-containing protein C589.09, mitochondrial-like [Salvia splendens]|uniref:CRAL-TRIO domain-containing protein C589.09, mitochondrial-like n=1 Tax=Salvia splendens TaxID=180675 RepID=UPI001C264767|nr:CRAL-TRIO domain-containing protein C589.09, mitochondrial-like [Salvia splendens]
MEDNESLSLTVSKLTKAIDFRVSELSEESVKRVAETGKARLHDYLDVHNRPVLIVEASKHLPGEYEPNEDESLCVFLIEKALSKLPEGQQQVVILIDLRGFQTQNTDLKFLTFVFDASYCYYPRRLGQVLFVDAPFIFKPFWQLVKPLLKSYASLVRFCSVKEVKEEYFTADTIPTSFR